MNSDGTSGEYILVNSVVKLFLIIVGVFLCESDFLMKVIYIALN